MRNRILALLCLHQYLKSTTISHCALENFAKIMKYCIWINFDVLIVIIHESLYGKLMAGNFFWPTAIPDVI